MSDVTVTIDGKTMKVKQGTSILEAAKEAGITIPTLCYFNLENADIACKPASCRVCVVEVEGSRNLLPSCVTSVSEGMIVRTNSKRAINARKMNIELLLSDHPNDCLTCPKSGSCDLQRLTQIVEVRSIDVTGTRRSTVPIEVGKALKRDLSKCIMCRRCETMCSTVQSVYALSAIHRGFPAYVGTAFEEPLSDTVCVSCGQCSAVCPVGAITENDEVEKVIDALADRSKTVVFQTAPSVRVAIGEEFGLPPGTEVTGKMITALRRLGADYVFDTNFAADLTIMEESAEIIERLKAFLNNEKVSLPITTSCCPGWVNFFESQFSEMLDLPSTAKSPQGMFGAVAKNYFTQKLGIKREDMVVVSIMPCTAKKVEADREALKVNGNPDVDIVLTTRETARLFKLANIDFTKLEDSEFDEPLGESTGAASIFGVTGGVLEAALRTVYETLEEKPLKKVEFLDVRGFSGVKTATMKIAGIPINVAVVHGLANARKIMDEVKEGNPRELHVIEVMACPGGCIGGGGQPYHRGDGSVLSKRTSAIYEIDKDKKIRKSHDNSFIKELYQNYYGEPLSHLAHEQLHTHYTATAKY